MHTVDITPLYSIANDLLQYLGTGLAIIAAAWIRWAFHKYITPYIGAQLETKAADDLNTALSNGVQVALVQLQAWETAHKDAEVQGAIQRIAVQYAIDHAPQAVDHFGLNVQQLSTKALAYIPAPPPSSAGTTGAKVPVIPVDVMTIPPPSKV